MNWLKRSLTKTSGSGKTIAYHATVAGRQIIANGFKTREQLGDRAILGGGTSNSVSFTTDWLVAKGVFDGVILAWQIANAQNPLDFIKQHYSNLSPSVQTNVGRMFQSAHGGDIDMLLNGWVVSEYGSNPLTDRELVSLGYRPIPGQTVGERHYKWLRPINKEEQYNLAYGYLKSYHAADDSVYNPVFFGTDIKNFLGIQRADIGIITAEIEIDPARRGQDDYSNNMSHRYVGSMAEIRIYDLNTIKILDFDQNPGNSPKRQIVPKYYSALQSHEDAINSFFGFVYENYDALAVFLKKHEIAIDGFTSLLQQYGDNTYKIYQVIRAVEDKTQIKYMRPWLEHYEKYKSLIEVPDNIANYLSDMPHLYRERILNGERSTSVFSDFYDNDAQMYDRWSQSQEDAYVSEKELEHWSWDRLLNLETFNRYGQPDAETLKQHYSENEFQLVASFARATKELLKSLTPQG